MQTIDLGRLAMKATGALVPTATYSFNSVVVHNGSAYVWSSQTPGNSTDFSGNGNWKLLVKGMAFVGEWTAGDLCLAGGIYLHNGSTWLALQDTTAEPRLVETTHWAKLAAGWMFTTFALNTAFEAGMVFTIGACTYLVNTGFGGVGTMTQLAAMTDGSSVLTRISSGSRYTGQWQPGCIYFPGDTFTYNGGLYSANAPLTTGATFAATDGVLQSQQVPLGSTSDVKKVLTFDGVSPVWTTSAGQNFTPVSTPATLVSGMRYLVTAASVTLPASPSVGDSVLLKDGGNWGATPVSVYRNGSLIEGIADDLLLDISRNVSLTFINSTTGWSIS